MATGSKSFGGLVVASRRLRETIVKVSTQTTVVSRRGGQKRRTEEECIFEARQASTRRSSANMFWVECSGGVLQSVFKESDALLVYVVGGARDPSVSQKFLSELQSAGTHALRQEEDAMLKPFAGVLVSEASERSQV